MQQALILVPSYKQGHRLCETLGPQPQFVCLAHTFAGVVVQTTLARPPRTGRSAMGPVSRKRCQAVAVGCDRSKLSCLMLWTVVAQGCRVSVANGHRSERMACTGSRAYAIVCAG